MTSVDRDAHFQCELRRSCVLPGASPALTVSSFRDLTAAEGALAVNDPKWRQRRAAFHAPPKGRRPLPSSQARAEWIA